MKNVKISKSWAEVTHKQYFCLRTIVQHDLTTDFDVLYDLVNCLTDLPESELLQLTYKQLIEFKNAFDFISTPLFAGEINTFEHEGVAYKLPNFLNQWFVKIILNNLYKFDTAEFHERVLKDDLGGLPLLLALWSDAGETDFNHGKVMERAAIFETLGISTLLGGYAFYCSQMQAIAKNFDMLFKKTYIKNAEYYAHIVAKYGWECSVSELAAGDVTKKNAVYMASIFDALQELEMRKQTNLANQKLTEIANA